MGKQENESAFPTEESNYEKVWSSPGMTLRDYFAAKAMQSISLALDVNEQQFIANTAYRMADAMLLAREANND